MRKNYRPTTCRTSGNTQGFTLVELLIVVALMVLLAAMMLPKLSSYFRISLQSAAREFATTVKQGYNTSIITGRVYRVAYDLKKNQYWVEGGPANVLLDTKETKEKEEHRKRFALSTDKEPESVFGMDPTVTRKKVDLPTGVTFEDIITEKDAAPITTGMAYTHFFPGGITEQTLVHLQDTSNHHLSLMISPLVGRTEMYDRYVDPKDAFGK